MPNGSGVSREAPAPFYEGLEGKYLRSTHHKLHWRLDVVFNEDKACIRNDNASENMDIVRKWALNILHKAKTQPDQSIKSVMRKNAMSFKHLLASVNKIFSW